MTMTDTRPARPVHGIGRGVPAEDGAGVKLTRVIGTHMLADFDPMLMLDEIRSDDAQAYIAGFPPHPHRGFETVTYMVTGKMRHRDNKGGEGLIESGGVQWMTAARGIVHSEMPEQQEGLLFGFQLWINLPSTDKMADPWYRDIPASAIPQIAPADGVAAKLIAGSWAGAQGPAPQRATAPFIADVHLDAYAVADVPVPETHSAFAYVYDGAVSTGQAEAAQRLERGRIAVYKPGQGDLVLKTGASPARALVVAGKPLNEPIAKYGPFVMNTQAELQQAVTDFRAGRF